MSTAWRRVTMATFLKHWQKSTYSVHASHPKPLYAALLPSASMVLLAVCFNSCIQKTKIPLGCKHCSVGDRKCGKNRDSGETFLCLFV